MRRMPRKGDRTELVIGARRFTLRPILHGDEKKLTLHPKVGELGREVTYRHELDETRESVLRCRTGEEQARLLGMLDEHWAALQTYIETRPTVPIPEGGEEPEAAKKALEEFAALEATRKALTDELSTEDKRLARRLNAKDRQEAAAEELRARFAVVGWSGVTDEDGAEVACVRDGDDLVSEAAFELVTPAETKAIAAKAGGDNFLDDDDRKNSDSPSGSPTDLTSATAD